MLSDPRADKSLPPQPSIRSHESSRTRMSPLCQRSLRLVVISIPLHRPRREYGCSAPNLRPSHNVPNGGQSLRLQQIRAHTPSPLSQELAPQQGAFLSIHGDFYLCACRPRSCKSSSHLLRRSVDLPPPVAAIPERAYWHDQNRLGYGNVGFVDTHVKYLQAMYNKSGFERGSTCFFVYND